jgi:hypothetical protein
MHISYYGSSGAPQLVANEEITWSQDGGRSKFNGLYSCIKKMPRLLDKYDYIAIPDDDLICSKDDWNTAFFIAEKFGLGACQLSVLPRTYYSHDITLRRRGLLLRFVSVLEPMALIIRMDVFRKLLPAFELPDNLWAIDYILASLLIDQPTSAAILDIVSVSHTRAVLTGPVYESNNGSSKSPQEICDAFMKRHGYRYYDRRLLGAIDSSGREVADLTLIERKLQTPDLLRRYRKKRRIHNIARLELALFAIRRIVERAACALIPGRRAGRLALEHLRS